jgi:hypothetical protein
MERQALEQNGCFVSKEEQQRGKKMSSDKRRWQK